MAIVLHAKRHCRRERVPPFFCYFSFRKECVKNWLQVSWSEAVLRSLQPFLNSADAIVLMQTNRALQDRAALLLYDGTRTRTFAEVRKRLERIGWIEPDDPSSANPSSANRKRRTVCQAYELKCRVRQSLEQSDCALPFELGHCWFSPQPNELHLFMDFEHAAPADAAPADFFGECVLKTCWTLCVGESADLLILRAVHRGIAMWKGQNFIGGSPFTQTTVWSKIYAWRGDPKALVLHALSECWRSVIEHSHTVFLRYVDEHPTDFM